MPAAVRLAAVYAMAGLADDWEENRQTCVDVLCAYLRMPYPPDPGKDASEEDRIASQASREVRHGHPRHCESPATEGLDVVVRAGSGFHQRPFRRRRLQQGEFRRRNGQLLRSEVQRRDVSFYEAKFSGGASSSAGRSLLAGM
jgi:hypothetical protein